MRDRATQESAVQHAGQFDVADEAALAAQKRCVFQARDGAAEPA